MTTTLDAYLKADPTRCSRCGYHPLQGHGEACAPIAPADEWTTFLAALRSSVRDGRISQTDVRPKIQSIAPKHRGTFYRRAVAEGLIAFDGWEDSTDVLGRNADKKQRVYRWTGGAR